MKEAIKLISRLVDSGRSYAKRGLLYEAAYRYGQALAAMNVLYTLHSEEVVHLDPAVQSFLAQTQEKLVALSMSLERSAGNGRHKIGDANADAKQSLLRVIEVLHEDLEGPPWSDR